MTNGLIVVYNVYQQMGAYKIHILIGCVQGIAAENLPAGNLFAPSEILMGKN